MLQVESGLFLSAKGRSIAEWNSLSSTQNILSPKGGYTEGTLGKGAVRPEEIYKL